MKNKKKATRLAQREKSKPSAKLDFDYSIYNIIDSNTLLNDEKILKSLLSKNKNTIKKSRKRIYNRLFERK